MRRIGAILAVIGGLAIGVVREAQAHPPARGADREIVRIQGYRGLKPKETPIVRKVTLSTLGVPHDFYATEWRNFTLSDPLPDATPNAEAARLTLQGSRELLARFAGARPEQTISLLAEHRPGSIDLFVLALDLCPPR